MPHSAALATLAVSATKCRATSCPPWAANQSSAERALAMVSSVVKVLEATMNSVLSGRTACSTLASSWPSMLETK